MVRVYMNSGKCFALVVEEAIVWSIEVVEFESDALVVINVAIDPLDISEGIIDTWESFDIDDRFPFFEITAILESVFHDRLFVHLLQDALNSTLALEQRIHTARVANFRFQPSSYARCARRLLSVPVPETLAFDDEIVDVFNTPIRQFLKKLEFRRYQQTQKRTLGIRK